MKLYWPRLTILGRSVALITALILFNAGCWIAAAFLFRNHAGGDANGIMGLAMLSWTIGLRHALDADHISAIDNATRGLINLGQLPTTCGLFFSLGHSTIVVAFIVAIAISSDVYDRVGGFSKVGGIVGSAVSGSFLFIIGTVNSIILYRIIRDRRRGVTPSTNSEDIRQHGHSTIMMRILAPVTKIVDRPWKMYPVGVLFGLGFDTASSIALLAVSALAKRDAHGKGIPSASIVVLPFLFTAGMSIVDSLDSVLMLYSYAGFPERGWKLFRRENKEEKSAAISSSSPIPETERRKNDTNYASPKGSTIAEESGAPERRLITEEEPQDEENPSKREEAVQLKNTSMSTLSILLTLISILLAFTISLITIMSLIGDQCSRCRRAAEAEDGHGGGLEGRWWRAWASASDASGYIGAGIVGGFVAVVTIWYVARYVLHKANKAGSSPTSGSVA